MGEALLAEEKRIAAIREQMQKESIAIRLKEEEKANKQAIENAENAARMQQKIIQSSV